MDNNDNKKQSLLEEIHAQPEHIRSWMMWLSIIITISIIGAFWVSSTKHQLALLTDPQGVAKEEMLARKEEAKSKKLYENDSSPFAMIYKMFGDMRATIGQFTAGSTIEIKNSEKTVETVDNIEAKETSRPSLPLIDNYNKYDKE